MPLRYNSPMTRALLSIAALLLLAACTGGPGEATLSKAMKGDTRAMFRMAEFYCAREDAGDKGEQTLKWWKKLADGKNAAAAAQANEYLGLYYLSLFANEDTYNPDAPEPISYCTGSPEKPAYARATRHFVRCAEALPSCRAALGHLNQHRKDYAKAYFWYATLLADITPEGEEISPLDTDVSTTRAAQNARRAAEHLTPDRVASIGKTAQEWVKARRQATN